MGSLCLCMDCSASPAVWLRMGHRNASISWLPLAALGMALLIFCFIGLLETLL